MMERKQATTDTNGTENNKKTKFDWKKVGKRVLRIGELCFAGIGAVGVGSLVYDKFQARKGPKPPIDTSGPEI